MTIRNFSLKTFLLSLMLITVMDSSSVGLRGSPVPTVNQAPSPLAESRTSGFGNPETAISGLLQYKAGKHVLGFQTNGLVIASGSHVLKVRFVNASLVTPVDARESPDAAKRLEELSPLSRVSYHGIWDGITAVYEGTEIGLVKSTYFVQPGEYGACPRAEQIKLRYNVPVKIDANGNLVLTFAAGEMRETRPVSWQVIKGKRVVVECEYRLLGTYEVGFKIGPYDPRYSLVIDPSISWNTFLGGTGSDYGKGIAIDESGNIYVIGDSGSDWGTSPRPFSGLHDAFVAKLNSDGILQWNTFLGGDSYDYGYGIDIDVDGNVYVTGESRKAWGTPIRPFIYGCESNCFVAKLSTNGNLEWNTFLGGMHSHLGLGIAVDTNGNAYVSGISLCSWGSPIRPFSASSTGYNWNGFVAKLGAAGNLLWNTFLGGQGDSKNTGISLDINGSSYVVGHCLITWGSPVRPFSGVSSSDAFVAKLDTNGLLLWNTFLGSSNDDYGNGIAVDSEGNSYATGPSTETWGLPVRPFAGGDEDCFVVKLDTNGNLQWNTFLGGSPVEGDSYSGDDGGRGIIVDIDGNSYVTGWSSSSWASPLRPFATHSAGDQHGFVAKLDEIGVLQWNIFLGATMILDSGEGIAGDLDGNSYVIGNSSGGNWRAPVRPYAGGSDAFVAKIPTNPVAQPEITSLSPSNVFAGGLDFNLSVVGFNFVDGSIVRWDGADRPTTFVSRTEILATIGGGDITVAKTVAISVRNPDGEISPTSLEFKILPSLTALVPSSARVGDPGFTLVVAGSAFVDGTVVMWDNADRPTTFVSNSQVNAAIGAADIAVAKVVHVTVRVPSGEISNALDFSVNYPAPILTALVPSSATAGNPGFMLAVTGSNFRSGATIFWGGNVRSTTFVNSYEVDAAIGAGDITLAGTVQVTVENTDLQTSNALVFTINRPLPTLASLSPTRATGGGGSFNLTLLGTNFVAGSIVKWNGVDKSTTYISPTELHAAIIAGDIAIAGEVQVTVVNPTPPGDVSNPLTFPVSGFMMNSSPISATVTAGQSAAYAIQITPQYGSFDSAINFTTTGLPRNTTATITPASITPGANTVAVALNITTRASSTMIAGTYSNWSGLWLTAVGIALVGLALISSEAKHRSVPIKRHLGWIPALALVILIGLIASCGAGGDNNPPPNNRTPAGTYQITVQGTSGSLNISTIVTLVVR